MKSIDISECEKESIHIPGFIQPHGKAISYDQKSKIITGASTNFENAIGLVGLNIYELINKSLWEEMVSTIEESIEEFNQNIFYNEKAFNQSELFDDENIYDIIWNNCGNEVMLEFIQCSLNTQKISNHCLVAENFQRILPHHSLDSICHQGALEVQKMTGFDRVMIYKFDEEFNGCVISEIKNDDMNPYLDLNFPSSDIPPQARELYRKQTVRVIRDVHYKAVDFIRQSNLEPLDMTYSYLRSVSPVHIEYLINMGVAATLTISIIIDGELWGLIACHHCIKHSITPRQIEISRAFGVILSGMIKTRIDNRYQRQSVHLLSTVEAIANGIQIDNKSYKNTFDFFSQKASLFHSLFKSNSFVLISENKIAKLDNTCKNSDIIELLSHIKSKMINNLFYTSNLKSIFPDCKESILKECSGALVVLITQSEPSYWIWFRHEITQTLTWGGDPKNKVIVNSKGKISPRASFEAFKEVVRYKSDPWEKADIDFIPDFISIVGGLYKTIDSKKKIQDMEDEKTTHYRELLESLVDMIEKRDAYTAGHTKRVSNYCGMISDQIPDVSKKEKAQLYEAAILHDIGKVVVPDAILLKPGRLSKNEFALIKTHLSAGYEILNNISYYSPLAEIIKYHHEKYDGSGYPTGVKGNEIPLLAHIMIVADALDAMTSNRIYQSRKSMKEAVDEIVRYRGIWYDPQVVDATVLALKNMKDDLSTSQIPLTPLEQARFSYYYKDQLTGIYNESYLKMVTEHMISKVFYSHFIIADIVDMSNYNKNNGWHAGDIYIQEIGNKIQNIFLNENIFRIYGDNFIIGCNSMNDAIKYEQMIIDEKISNLRVSKFDLQQVIFMLKR
jgi:HD-GYP domain-containing protein (c-di-GMP phosphodiesterase class II)